MIVQEIYPALSAGFAAYNSAMEHIAWLALLLIPAAPALTTARVRVSVPSQTYTQQQRIVATVQNMGKRAITVCVEVGQTSQIGGETKSTPYPFTVQQKSQSKWSTLLIGPDVGSFRGTNVLKPGESLEFPFALNSTGQMRLLLEFWNVETPPEKCSELKGSKKTTSNTFLVRE